MKIILAAILFAFLAGALQGCAFLATPLATGAFGGAQLAIKGAELEQQIRKADVRKAIDASFEQAWVAAVTVPADLDIAITRSQANELRDGGVVEGVVKSTRIKILVAELTEKVTEIGVWANGDKALAELIAEKINEHAKVK